MKELALSRSIRLMCAGTIAMSMQVAVAQTAAAPVQQVLVTGSRIYSPGAESPAPMQVLTAADIAASGATNVQELLLKNPTMGTPTLSRTNSNFLTSGNGVATVDLRNLGTERTLVLINGRRMVAGTPGSSEVDLNTIPTDFIERIELLTGGASATYGSDAVAGVVNIILKKKFNGFVFDTSYGESEKGDDTRKKISASFGTTSADGASNLMGHVGYSRQGAVFTRDREMSATDQRTRAATTGLVSDVFNVQKPFYSGYIPAGTFFHDTGAYTYDAAGNPIPTSTNGSATQAPTGYNRSAGRYIAVPVERFLMSATGTHALNDNHSVFFEGMYANTKASSLIEPLPFDSEGPYPIDGQVPAEFNINGAMVRNPLVPQYLYDRIIDNNGDGARDYYFTRRMADMAVRSNKADRDTFRVLGGVKGSMFNWNYETYYAYGSTKEAQTGTGQINVLNFRNALEAIPDGAGGVMCRDATARAQGCVPINIFGANTISTAAQNYVNAPSFLATKTTQKLAGASVSGELFNLPAGAVGLAAGGEWREEEASSESDVLTQLGLNAGNATPNTFGKFSVKEFFVEARVPLLKDAPFAKNLNLLSAVRVGDYSTIGKADSWNIGFEWSPISDVRIRATRALSTRAPNINELYSPASQTFPSVTDPCVGVTATSADAKSVACRAAVGVNANIAANGGVFTLTQADAQGVSGFNRGNPLVQEEKGRSTTFGIVYTPRSIPMLSKFTFTADYFDIKIAGAIVGTPRDYALNNCYGGDATMCGFITRRPAAVGANSAGSLEFVDSAVSNSGGLSTEGVDVTAGWADNVGPGRLNARVAYTYVKTNDSRPLPGAPIDPSAGEVGAAKHKSSIILGYKIGSFNIVSNTQTISRSCIDDQYVTNLWTDSTKTVHAAPCSATVKAKIYNDFQLTYQVKKQVELYVGVDNAFDTKAPLIPTSVPGNDTGVETNAGTYDPIGRRWYAGLRIAM